MFSKAFMFGSFHSSFQSVTKLRTFDPMNDQHPVMWLLRTMDNNLYPALNEWIKEILDDEIPFLPSDVCMPAGQDTKMLFVT